MFSSLNLPYCSPSSGIQKHLLVSTSETQMYQCTHLHWKNTFQQNKIPVRQNQTKSDRKAEETCTGNRTLVCPFPPPPMHPENKPRVFLEKILAQQWKNLCCFEPLQWKTLLIKLFAGGRAAKCWIDIKHMIQNASDIEILQCQPLKGDLIWICSKGCVSISSGSGRDLGTGVY